MILKAIICLFKGHDINPDESIVGDIMIDKRNWLCKCHRCGLYEMRDGAISNQKLTLTKSGAYRFKMEFERDVMNMRQWADMKNKMTGEIMEFPETFDEFADSYGFIDTEKVYTNGSQLISVFRVKQWLEHISASSKNKGEWIPVSERLPKIADVYRVTRYYPNNVMNPKYLVDACAFDGSDTWYNDNRINHERAYADNVIAWQENPEPYKAERGE